MLILTIRTDKPEAELGLYQDYKKLDYFLWQAHRELSDTIHLNIDKLLKKNNSNLSDIEGLIIYKGPGSFTGLRIGFSLANALAYSLNCSIVATNEEDWIKQGVTLLKATEASKQAFPFYGAEVNITKAKK
jgi:tRNA threonylcarbamoyladenosine biosynthesis protein TsaB